jgi:GNAT superfamily N-acetyltransferase
MTAPRNGGDAASVCRIGAAADAPLQSLVALLIDVVNGGASVGFLAPLSRERAAAYWSQVMSSLGSALALWVAEADGRVVGSVQLALCEKENGRLRADLQKLIVLRAYRGRGVAAALVDAAEAFARADRRSLLVLDTEAQSPAERVYQRLGWQRVGESPRYAARTDGELWATAYYYKRLP